MAHAHHFLTRLDRLDDGHVALALTLYRDHALTAHLLHRLRLPEGVERVGLSLAHPTDGPFVVVQRSGAFVTCLAPGMRLSPEVFVVPRARLDAEFAYVGEFRRRGARATELVEERGSFERLMRRVFVAGDQLGREEFFALGVVAPIVRIDLLRQMFGEVDRVNEARAFVAGIDRVRPAHHAALRAYWNSLWAIGHLQLLTGLGDPSTMFDSMGTAHGEPPATQTLTWGAVRQNCVPLAVRAAWFVGSYGAGLLDSYAAVYRGARTLLEVTNSGLALIALGSRHPDLADTVGDLLRAEGTPSPMRMVGATKGLFSAVFDGRRDPDVEPDSLDRDLVLDPARSIYQGLSAHLPATSPYRFATEAEVPADLALPLLLSVPLETLGEASILQTTACLCAHMQRLPAESFFLPAEAERALRREFHPRAAVDVARYVTDMQRAAPIRAEKIPGRNDPCRCGSGKKFKRCCAGAPVAPVATNDDEE